MAANVRKNIVANAKRIVVKVGTNALCDEQGRLDESIISQLAKQIVSAQKRGVFVTLVASGAIGAGITELDLAERPRVMSRLQATAAVGQGRLMRAFHDAFEPLHCKIAEILLLRDDFEHRRRYLNIRNTINALEAMGHVTPIINENDAVGEGKSWRQRRGRRTIDPHAAGGYCWFCSSRMARWSGHRTARCGHTRWRHAEALGTGGMGSRCRGGNGRQRR